MTESIMANLLLKESADIGTELYKYREFNKNNFKILSNGELYFPTAAQFDDPYDCSIFRGYTFRGVPIDKLNIAELYLFIDYICRSNNYPFNPPSRRLEYYKDYVDRCMKIKGFCNIEDLSTKLEFEMGKFARSNARVYCLSSTPTDEVMWSYYGKNATGFCVAFDWVQLSASLGDYPIKVTYQENFPCFEFDDTVLNKTKTSFATKLDKWEHEQEYRLIKYEEPRDKFKISSKIIKKVYLGYRIKSEDKNKIIDCVKTDLRHCQVFDIKVGRNNLEPIRIL